MWRGSMLCLLLAGAVHASPALPENPFPHIAGSYLVKHDGVLLWAESADRRMPPASLAKLMTALLVLENGNLERSVVVSRAAAAETGSRIGLRAGERLVADDLLAAMLIASANDACHALASDLAGSEGEFVTRMNARAEALGLRNTKFANACGHDAAGQYSTAADLAVIAEQDLAYPRFVELVAMQSARIVADGGRRFELKTSNALLGRYPGVSGVKTGFTPAAGKCLVALAERNGRRVLLVLLDAPDRWWSASDVLDRAFSAADAR
jgi:serine-type D-Ala-D-Ala carboxypeptidase (penicillin-binding protein 5/6)